MWGPKPRGKLVLRLCNDQRAQMALWGKSTGRITCESLDQTSGGLTEGWEFNREPYPIGSFHMPGPDGP